VITKIKIKEIPYTEKSIDISKITNHNLIIAPNGWGKTQMIKAIRSKLFEDTQTKNVSLSFTEEFMQNPKHVYFTINEELDQRAIKDSISPFDSSSYGTRLVKTVNLQSMSNGQSQLDLLSDFSNDLIYSGCIWFLDEPEKSLDIVQVDKLIKKILSLDIQIFVISHSPLFLKNKKFNQIIIDQKYFDKSIKLLGY
jgi:predicted ATPase